MPTWRNPKKAQQEIVQLFIIDVCQQPQNFLPASSPHPTTLKDLTSRLGTTLTPLNFACFAISSATFISIL